MATTIVMPQLSSTMEKGTIVQWLKKVGEQVSEGEALIEINTDKVDVEVESPASGVLLEILVNEGDEVPVKKPVAVLGEAGEKTGVAVTAPTEAKAEETAKVEVTSQDAPTAKSGRIFASPRAKRLAKEAGVSLAEVAGTGPNGRVISKDINKHVEEGKKVVVETKPKIEKAIPAPKPPPAPGQVIKLSTIQKVVADRLTMSYRTAPHIALIIDVNCEKMIALRETLKFQGYRVSYNDIIAKYTAVVMRQFPKFNATHGEDGIHLLTDINIGIATAVGEELIVPVVKNVDKKDLKEVATESGRLIIAAREKKLSLEDISGGTFTITNLGMFGIRSFAAIINPPQVAILAVGVIEPRAVVVPGHIIAQQMMTLSLSIDHRVVNGAQGGEFLARLKELIESGSLDILMSKALY